MSQKLLKTAPISMMKGWQDFQSDILLEILESPYRSVGEALTHFLALFEERRPGVFLTLIIPAFVTRNWWEGLLHNQTAFFLKAALLAKKSLVVTTVRYFL